MESKDVKKNKQAMRKKILNERRQLTAAYCKEANRRIAATIMELPEFKAADTIFCFVSMEGEVDTLPLLVKIMEEGKKLVVPKCISSGIMNACHISGLDQLNIGAYGILEPAGGCGVVSSKEVDFAIVPCMSCDINGRRLGYGGGYYDRYLMDRTYPAAVICQEKLMSREIPSEPWDQIMDLVVTEERVVRITDRS